MPRVHKPAHLHVGTRVDDALALQQHIIRVLHVMELQEAAGGIQERLDFLIGHRLRALHRVAGHMGDVLADRRLVGGPIGGGGAPPPPPPPPPPPARPAGRRAGGGFPAGPAPWGPPKGAPPPPPHPPPPPAGGGVG